jgi:hypothetical protein
VCGRSSSDFEAFGACHVTAEEQSIEVGIVEQLGRGPIVA